MKTRSFAATLAGLYLLTSCRTPSAGEGASAEEHSHDQETVTAFSGGYELFADIPTEPNDSWLLHLTRLDGSRPVEAESCSAGGERGGTIAPGLVRLNKFDASVGEIQCRIEGSDIRFDIRGGPDREEPGGVRFLKEQQWTLPFLTAFPERRSLRESLRIPAEFRARPGALAAVSAPLAGRIEMEPTTLVGATVQKGDVLASVLPPTPAAADLASIELAREEAQAALELAQRELERVEQLIAADAAPRKRLDEAKAGVRSSRARVEAAELRMRQYESSRDADGREIGARRFLLRAAIAGAIVEVNAPTGAYIEAGDSVARIADTAVLHAIGFVPEAFLPRLAEVTGAAIELSDGSTLPAGRRVAVGRLLDPEARTLPVTYEVANQQSRLAIHQAAYLRLWLKSARDVMAVPEEAVLDEGAQKVVYVQTSGETFARRVVEPGMKSEGWIELRSGVKARDRVVWKGAYLVKLASVGSQAPAHGHIH